MKWLPLLVYVLTAPTMAGSIMVAILTMRDYSNTMLIGGALAGFIVAVPVTWFITRQLKASIKT